METITALGPEFSEYLRDESRSVGHADSISFPRSEDEVRAILKTMFQRGTPVTVQGGRTGLAAAAVPDGGHVLNLSRMDKITRIRRDEDGRFYLTVQPGLVLSHLTKSIEDRRFDHKSMDAGSRAALQGLLDAPEQFFPVDPTETSATIGGMAACNASGARTYRYGAMRRHVSALRVLLADGRSLSLRRGEQMAGGRSLTLKTEDGTSIDLHLPTYTMPDTKNASGYYVEDDMDTVDLFIGSDGTLGVITEVELALLPSPGAMWEVSCLFRDEDSAIDFVEAVKSQAADVATIEFFDADALDILRRQKETNPAFSRLPKIASWVKAMVSVELHSADDSHAQEHLFLLGSILSHAGGYEEDTWVARNQQDLARLKFIRHAIPESVNMMIDERRKVDPVITKLGTDMSVPDRHLRDAMDMYRQGLRESGLQSAIWGHIGDNHLHVNILPRSGDEYRRGKDLYLKWAKLVTEMGGAVAAEHGVGKLKTPFLRIMYGDEHVREMYDVKRALDPKGLLGTGNLFGGEGGASS